VNNGRFADSAMGSYSTLSRGVILERSRLNKATTPPSGQIVTSGVAALLPASSEEEALESAPKVFTSLLVGLAFAGSAFLAYPAVQSIFYDPSESDSEPVITATDLQMRLLGRGQEPTAPLMLSEPSYDVVTETVDRDIEIKQAPIRAPPSMIRVVQVGRSLQSSSLVASTKKAEAPKVYQTNAPSLSRLYSADVVSQVFKVIKRHGKKGVNQPELASAIVSEAKRQNYDPLFVAAVIKSESAFNTFATSHVGAKGLMQIMPKTGEYIKGFKELEGIPRGALTQPGYNLRLGIAYLKYLEKMFEGNKVLTLIAYNWGPGHVIKTVRGEKSGVPRSVMNYALKILHDHSRWHEEVEKSSYS
jgi:soluble lytic murein transglycosylase